MFRWNSGRALVRLIEAASVRAVGAPWRSAIFRLLTPPVEPNLDALAPQFDTAARHLIDVRATPFPLAAVRYDPGRYAPFAIMTALHEAGLDVGEELPSSSASLWSTQALWSPGRN